LETRDAFSSFVSLDIFEPWSFAGRAIAPIFDADEPKNRDISSSLLFRIRT
jgi:hypothetical protein